MRVTPYHFSNAEMWAWLGRSRNLRDVTGRYTVGGYIDNAMTGAPDPPQGIVVWASGVPDPIEDITQGGRLTDIPGADREIVVWVDASRKIHVVDVTGMAIAREIPKQAFESPDTGLIESFLHSLADAQTLILWAMVAAVGLAILTRR